jgi:hypothetical protein
MLMILGVSIKNLAECSVRQIPHFPQEVVSTMKYRVVAGFVACAMVVAVGTAGDSLKSGPQVGKSLAGPFHPLNVTGAKAGVKHCLV